MSDEMVKVEVVSRYQLKENIRMLKLFLPIIWSVKQWELFDIFLHRTHTSFGFFGASLYVVVKLLLPDPEWYPMIEVCHNFFAINAL